MKWIAGGYSRLSLEDDIKGQSNSITNQKELINQFLSRNSDINLFDFYSDDGYSGTNFDRPGFQKMLDDIISKRVNTVIVKDLSRLGRNYIEVGRYIEDIFPRYNIRFIAINDNIDSYRDPSSLNNIVVSFKNLMNDEYCRDISNKIKSSLMAKRRNGEWVGSYTPYGYIKDPNDKHKLIIDEEAAKVVKQIFKLADDGYGFAYIARYLNDLGTLSPSDYKIKVLGYNYANRYYKTKIKPNTLWRQSTVSKILRDEIYAGDTIQMKRKKINYKIKKVINTTDEEKIISRNTHIPIIDRETFNKIQEKLFTRFINPDNNGVVYLYSGFIRCYNCKRDMLKVETTSKKNKDKKVYIYYCSTFRRSKKRLCSCSKIRTDKLDKILIKVIQNQINLIISIDNSLNKINKKKSYDYQSEIIKNNIKTLECELEKKELIKKELYKDWKLNILSESDYNDYVKDYNYEINNINTKLKKLREDSNLRDTLNSNNVNWIDEFKKYQKIKNITRNMLEDLINMIYIDENSNVIVEFKYQDEYKKTLEFLKNNGVATKVKNVV